MYRVRIHQFHSTAILARVEKVEFFHLPVPQPVASFPDYFYIGEEGEDEEKDEPNAKESKPKAKMRAKQVDTSGRLDVGEAVEGGSVKDEAVSAAPLPPEDDEEGQPAQPLARPDRPTPEMVAAHEVSQLPYRSWCRACVAGRGRAFQHTKLRLKSRQSLL